ncbi:AlpA family transcriptional regulator [Vibrio sp. B1Z05]|uniref:helix-turn-helix transcriptional regulator n=1 Tax=Vibrio sp. B1Z05 TaxID=2654980 RepID=UPI00128D16C4|nr:AlpA family phage regulatory protein [Vibrio sp. B1Z05]MPW37639.1 AlpA family phage regulatory protein [Vibrio sp. B1Z05]
MPEKLISIAQMCELLNRDRRTLWVWVKQGKFPKGVMLGKRTLGWTQEVYREWLNKQQEA